MEILAYPEAYINTTGDCNITNSNSAILPHNVLDKYKKEILDNTDGCIFKITYYNPMFECSSEAYVSCLEFSAPENSCFLPNIIFEKLLMDFGQPCNINIELFNPPQATFIKFEIMDTLLELIPDIKSSLEELLTQKYKFISKNQEIKFLDHIIKVKEILPFEVCMINNTDAEVEFDILKKIPIKPKPIPIEKPEILKGPIKISTKTKHEEDVPINDIAEQPIEKLSDAEIRRRRLEFYNKKFNSK